MAHEASDDSQQQRQETAGQLSSQSQDATTQSSSTAVAEHPADYDSGGFYDEMFDAEAYPRPDCAPLWNRINSISDADIRRRQKAAERSMHQLGITFNVYGDKEGNERIIPFDIVPRIIPGEEWKRLDEGLKQRIEAINHFIQDIYHDQKIIKDGVIPEHVIATAKGFRKQCVGITPPKGVWCHITGTDLVRGGDGQIYVLEDNLRCPSGVSYVLQNRQLMKQTFPQVFEQASVLPVDDYCSKLLGALQYLMEDRGHSPRVALLSPGIYNSAYFEHSFLAQQMGIDLVEGQDLIVSDDFVYKRTTHGFERVDVIYRRIEDDFLDPKAFREDSMLGVPGLMQAYMAGNVALANAPGTGVADDKVIYTYVPAMIEYYLGIKEPLIPNVPSYLCWDDAQRDHVLKNLDKLVVKPANEAGGYGLLIGPQSTQAERDETAAQIKANPRNFIAQPTLSLSRVPVLTEQGLRGRHVDLRPFIVYGAEPYVLPGGLTRVALKEGSLVVNSSQGGGSKDTWVVS